MRTAYTTVFQNHPIIFFELVKLSVHWNAHILTLIFCCFTPVRARNKKDESRNTDFVNSDLGGGRLHNLGKYLSTIALTIMGRYLWGKKSTFCDF